MHYIVDVLNYTTKCINDKKLPSTNLNRFKCLCTLVTSLMSRHPTRNDVYVHLCTKYHSTEELSFWTCASHMLVEHYAKLKTRNIILYAVRATSLCRNKTYKRDNHVLCEPDDFMVLALVRSLSTPNKIVSYDKYRDAPDIIRTYAPKFANGRLKIELAPKKYADVIVNYSKRNFVPPKQSPSPRASMANKKIKKGGYKK